MTTYDADLQMVVEPPAQVNRRYLEFLAWLYDQRRLEDDTRYRPMSEETRRNIFEKELVP